MILITVSQSHTTVGPWAGLAPRTCALIWKTGKAAFHLGTSQGLLLQKHPRAAGQPSQHAESPGHGTPQKPLSGAPLSALLNNSKPCFHFKINTATKANAKFA